jgi:hypothetical protein
MDATFFSIGTARARIKHYLGPLKCEGIRARKTQEQLERCHKGSSETASPSRRGLVNIVGRARFLSWWRPLAGRGRLS